VNTERNAYTGWMTRRDRQLFHVLLDGLPAESRTEVVDALARSERERYAVLRDHEADGFTEPGRRAF
jgi:hypothetical protein